MGTCYNTSCQSHQKWAVGNDIRRILLADGTISGLVGSNIFPLVAPENIDGEFIVYSRDAYAKHVTKMGVYEDAVELTLVAVSDNYDMSVQIVSAIDNALTGVHILNGNIRIQMSIITSNEAFEDNKYIQKITFEIK